MIEENLKSIISELPSGVKLVAVSKFHPLEAVQEAYKAGQRVFGENRPQELAAKVPAFNEWLASEYPDAPQNEVEWHFLGHLQTNKLKMVLPYVSLVQSIDSVHLLQAVNDWGKANGKVTDILLELHIGAEETKQGFHEEEVLDILFNADKYKNVRFCGLMGMASHTDDMETVNSDFERIDSYMAYLVDLFPELTSFNQLSIGMSSDWKIAVRNGSTMVRIGTAIFGERQY
ncbi:MAG: YggS family pyridoxal phosphate-dependent enzyme [Bacteroidia bacterium]|nr:YggS family pyridoxal phosphate-dependent enzyme [Bacteroidia bacterium]